MRKPLKNVLRETWRTAERRDVSRQIAAGVEEDARRVLTAVGSLKDEVGEKRQRQEAQLATTDAELKVERQKLDSLPADSAQAC